MKTKSRLFAMMLAVLCCIMAFCVSAFADGEGYYSSNESGEETPPEAIEQLSISTETVPAPTGTGGEPSTSLTVGSYDVENALSGLLSMFGDTSLTPSGNMTLVDDILQDESYDVQGETVVRDKQFITVQSKNGNTFYIIIDRSGDTENVYFLNLVDEADLLALMEDGESSTEEPACTCEEHCEAGAVDTDCPVCKNNIGDCMGKQTVKAEPEEESPPEDEAEPAAQDEPARKKSSSGLPVLILILLLAGGGALYWFKFRNKKPDTRGNSDLDDYFDDEEDETEYETETEDETPESEEINDE